MNLFRPYIKLKTDLRIYCDGPYDLVAKINDAVIGSIRISSKNAEDIWAWKDKLDRMLCSESSTVVLCTACNCTQKVDLDDNRQLVEYLVPVCNKVNSQYGSAITNTNQPVFRVRRFRWNYRHSNEGFKLLEECLE